MTVCFYHVMYMFQSESGMASLAKWLSVWLLSGCGFESHCSHLVFNALQYCLSGYLQYSSPIYSTHLSACSTHFSTQSTCLFTCSTRLSTCSTHLSIHLLLVVLVCPPIVPACPLAVLAVLSVGLFITDPYNDNKMIILMNVK